MAKEEILKQCLREDYPTRDLDADISIIVRNGNIPAAIRAMEQYANQRALEVAGEAWDACYRWGAHRYSKMKTAPPPDRKTYLSNLKKKLEG